MKVHIARSQFIKLPHELELLVAINLKVAKICKKICLSGLRKGNRCSRLPWTANRSILMSRVRSPGVIDTERQLIYNGRLWNGAGTCFTDYAHCQLRYAPREKDPT